MTSNIGAPLLIDGITRTGEIQEAARKAVMDELRRHFRPEFLNRIDDVVLFKPLQLAEIKRIVDLLAAQIRKRLAVRQMTLELADTAREWLANKGYDPVYGARPLKRLLQREVETRIAREIISGGIPDGSRITLDVERGELVVRHEPGVNVKEEAASEA
jgi:ATP-dependent Clp protease ATP-binding subunit ClpB